MIERSSKPRKEGHPLLRCTKVTVTVCKLTLIKKLEVNTLEVLELVRDGHFGAQSCKIRVRGHLTCETVQIQSLSPYAGVSVNASMARTRCQ